MSSFKGQLLYLQNNTSGVLFYRSAFYYVDLKNGRKELITCVPESHMKRFFGRCRLLVRLLRMEPRCVEKLSDNKFVICYAHKVWLLNLVSKNISSVWQSRQGFSNPLNLCSDGESVFWGDYGNNRDHEVVNIYRLSADSGVDVVYTFPKGNVRHIHNIIWDKENMRFYIMTGDLEETSGIYVSDADWKTVMPVATGKQQYRAVVAYPCGDGLIYATDSVAKENYIYLLQDGGIRSLAAFPGSCIYGGETKEFYFFSSTVEPPEGRGLLNMITYKLGAGIIDRYAHLIRVRKCDLRIEEVLKVKKDIWPMKLFQYGSLMFPKGQKNSNQLWYYLMACKGDGHSVKVDM